MAGGKKLLTTVDMQVRLDNPITHHQEHKAHRGINLQDRVTFFFGDHCDLGGKYLFDLPNHSYSPQRT
ncbi:MAG: hypothetical protein ACI9J5_002496 [Paraglaciecola sp.]